MRFDCDAYDLVDNLAGVNDMAVDQQRPG